MPVTVANLDVQVGANIGGAMRGLNQVERQGQKTAGVLKNALGSGIGFAGAQYGMMAISRATHFAMNATIGFNDRLEQAHIAFSTMLKSGDAATKMLADLQAFAKTTPFEFPELLDAATFMKAMGFQAQEIMPWMEALGNAASAFSSGPAGIQAMVRAMGQMRGATKVNAQDMNQLVQVGVPAWQILADAMGLPISKIKEMTEARTIDAAVMEKAFLAYSKANFGGLMQKQSRTFSGAMSNIKDSLNQTIAGAFKPAFDVIRDLSVEFGDFLMTPAVSKFGADVAAQIKPLLTLERVKGVLFGVRDAITSVPWGEVANFAKQVAEGFISLARNVPWDALTASMKMAGEVTKAAFAAFSAMPKELQAAAIGALAVNKLTGGAITGVVGGALGGGGSPLSRLPGKAGELFTQRVWVVNWPPGMGMGPGGKGGPGGMVAGGTSKLFTGLALFGAVASLAELVAIQQQVSGDVKQQTKTVESKFSEFLARNPSRAEIEAALAAQRAVPDKLNGIQRAIFEGNVSIGGEQSAKATWLAGIASLTAALNGLDTSSPTAGKAGVPAQTAPQHAAEERAAANRSDTETSANFRTAVSILSGLVPKLGGRGAEGKQARSEFGQVMGRATASIVRGNQQGAGTISNHIRTLRAGLIAAERAGDTKLAGEIRSQLNRVRVSQQMVGNQTRASITKSGNRAANDAILQRSRLSAIQSGTVSLRGAVREGTGVERAILAKKQNVSVVVGPATSNVFMDSRRIAAIIQFRRAQVRIL